jgi:phospholipid/cholesterol/gamma-HCH transport system substrate-binding protein
MSKPESARNVRVGIFLMATTAVLLVVVFVLGRSQSLFSRKARLNAAFQNTNGLVVGAPVRLAGVDIGIVQHVRFDENLKEKRVHVVLGVESQYLDRIREDSIARLASKGLLGDMIINISVGSADKRQLQDGNDIQSQETEGLTEVIASVQDGIGEIRKLTGHVDERLKAVLTDDVARDVNRLTHSTADLLEKVEKGNGLVHAVIYDPRLKKDAAELFGGAREVVEDARRAIDRVDRVVAAVESGKGTIHDLLYKDDGTRLLAEAQAAVKELDGVITEVRTGKGLIHSLIYEEDRKNLIQNFTELSRILRQVGEEVAQGKGTVGALLKDPTV